MTTEERPVTDKPGVTEIADFARLPAHPLVSVYMATWNHECYIAEAIEGVLFQQTDFPVELVIGEDCSTDGTAEIVRGYQRRHPERVRVITGQRNVGGFRNSNRCLPLCRGKYIAFCEGDDFWQHPEKLRMQAAAMEESHAVTLCHTDYDRKTGARTETAVHRKHRTPHPARGDAYADLLHTWTVMTATAMYRADVIMDFLATEFNNPAWPFGDYNKALYASVRGSVAYIAVSTATWRKVIGSATNENPRRILALRLASLACREAFLARYPVSGEVRRDCLAQANQAVMKYAFFAGDRDAYLAARARLLDLGYPPARGPDVLIRAAMQARFPVLAIRALRRTKLHVTAN